MRTDYERRIQRVLDFIYDNPDADLSLERLADVAAMSPWHWHRVFQAMTGETLADAVRRIRLLRAEMLLVHQAEPVAQVAAQVGYPSAASFTRAFSTQYGMSPLVFRKAGRAGPGNPRFRGPVPVTRPVELRQIGPQRLAALTHRGDYNRFDRVFERLIGLLVTRGQPIERLIGVFYDDPAQQDFDGLRALAAKVVDADTIIEPPLEEHRLEGGKHAVMTVRGPYSQFSDAYDQLLGGWLSESGCEAADRPAFIRHLNPETRSTPEALVCEIWLPLA